MAAAARSTIAAGGGRLNQPGRPPLAAAFEHSLYFINNVIQGVRNSNVFVKLTTRNI